MVKRKRRLFVVIQSLQYLQAEEILDAVDENILVVMWADKSSQLHGLVSTNLWDKIYWIELRGTFYEIIKYRRYINSIINDLGMFDEVIVSSYYNNLMNIFLNCYSPVNKILLEDGNATLSLDTSRYYVGKKVKFKIFLLNLLGFDASPVRKIDIFTSYKCVLDSPPRIAKSVVYNDFSKIKRKIINLPVGNDIYFINSNYIKMKMIDKNVYLDFLKKCIDKYCDKNIKILLHRYDLIDDYIEINGYRGAEVIKLKECVEIYFSKIQSRPYLVLTAGSGATKTLYVIYGFNISVVMPRIDLFSQKHRKDVQRVASKYSEIFNVEFF